MAKQGKKGGFFGKLLALLLGILIGIVAGLGGLAAVLYYAFGVLSIGEIFGIVENVISQEIPEDEYVGEEYLEKSLSSELERVMEGRSIYVHKDSGEKMMPLNESLAHYVSCAMPIVSSGDIIGCVVSLKTLDGYGKNNLSSEVETRLVSTAAGFLGRQLEE